MQRVVKIVLLLLAAINVSKAQVRVTYDLTDFNRLVNDLKADTARIHTYIRDGNKYRYTGADTAYTLYCKALDESQRIGYNDGISKSLASMAICYGDKSEYEKSIQTYFKALDYANRKLIDSSRMISVRTVIYHNLASAYFYLGEYGPSAYYYYKIFEAERLNDAESRRKVFGVYLGIANIWLRTGRVKEAVYCYDKAEAFAHMFRDTSMLALVWSNKAVAIASDKKEDIALARYNSRKALAVYNEKKNTAQGWDADAINTSAQSANNLLGMLLVRADSPGYAIPYLEETLRMINASKDQKIEMRIGASSMLGFAYYRLRQPERAESYLLPALKEARSSGLKESLLNIYSVLAALNSVRRDYKTAYEYQLAYSLLDDTMKGAQNIQSANSLEVKTQLIEKDKKIVENELLLARREGQIQNRNLWIGGISVSTLLIGFIIVSRYRNKQYLQEKRIRILQQEQEIIQLKAMMEGEEKERKRIARDLHDGVSQTMSAAKINLMAIEGELGFNGTTQKAKFEKIIQLVDSSFKEVRTISHNMMPKALMEAGLTLVIKQFIDNIDSDVIKINLYCNGLDEHFDGNIETILYRVIQECVTNVIKHADATRLDIALNKDEDGVSVTIEDNGRGFDVAEARRHDGIGLKNIETRIHFLQGQVEFDSSPGNGTLVSIHVPLRSLKVNGES